MRFRVKHIEGIGYFAQVKTSFFSSWKNIAVPQTDLQARKLCVDFSKWEVTRPPQYTYLELNSGG